MFKSSKLTYSFLLCFGLFAVEHKTDASHHELQQIFRTVNEGAKAVRNVVYTISTLKNMNTNDLDKVLCNVNNISWDIIIPMIVGISASANYYNHNKPYPSTTGTVVSGISCATLAYIIGSVPKTVINKLIQKSKSAKDKIEDTIDSAL